MTQQTNTLPTVSVVVPCRNERHTIESFLESLELQDKTGFQLEVILADGMSDDGTREILRKCRRNYGWLRVIDNPGGIVSTGLNAAIRQAAGEVIVRMDAHTTYRSDYIRRCLEVLEASGADNVGGAPRAAGQDLRSRLFRAAHHSSFAVGGSRSHDVSFEGWVDSVFYGCWRKSTLEMLGPFDESLVRNQDDELNLRLTRSGGKIWQSRRIVCWYRPRRTLSGVFHQYFQYGFWKVAVIRKHRVPASWRHLAPGGFVSAHLCLLSLWSLSGSLAVGLLWGALFVCYGMAAVAAAAVEARRHGYLVALGLPPLFAVYHISYGLGFVYGLIRWPLSRLGVAGDGRWVTALTR